jgi:hypothetical protein
MFKPTSSHQQSFYSSKLFVGLQKRMLYLCTSPTEKLKIYTGHLQKMGINLMSYLIPGADDIFAAAIKGEDSSISRTDDQLDVIILRLVEAQDREWNRQNCAENTTTKLNKIVPKPWAFNFKSGIATAPCKDAESGKEIVETLRKNNIAAVLQRHTEKNTFFVRVRSAYAQTNNNSADSLAAESSTAVQESDVEQANAKKNSL